MATPTPSVQIVRLSAGRHASPQEGVCAMELASMLAGEPFSDRPRCVCAVVAAFLRGYNDALPDALRQELVLPWAAAAVGTRTGRPGEHHRRHRTLAAATRALVGPLRFEVALPPWRRGDLYQRCEGLGHACADAVRRDREAAGAVAELLAVLCGTAADPALETLPAPRPPACAEQTPAPRKRCTGVLVGV